MRRFRVNRKEGKIKKSKVIEKVAAYKYIPCHMHTIIFERVTFCEQKSSSMNYCFVYHFVKAGYAIL